MAVFLEVSLEKGFVEGGRGFMLPGLELRGDVFVVANE